MPTAKNRDASGGASGGSRQTVRIIAGQWRSRKIHFPDLAQLRPTPDRVRETLFNWLTPVIVGARCLDLFAGSGALGLEALSRGAAEAVFVDRDAQVVAHIRKHVTLFKAEHATVIQAEALEYLQHCTQQFDIVFLDPPYDAALLLPVSQSLEQHGLLHDQARIYLEARDGDLSELPGNWQLQRSKQAGQVAYHLAARLAK